MGPKTNEVPEMAFCQKLTNILVVMTVNACMQKSGKLQFIFMFFKIEMTFILKSMGEKNFSFPSSSFCDIGL